MTTAARIAADVQTLTFGVEIECNLPSEIFAAHPGLVVGDYHRGAPVPESFLPASPDGAAWKCERDGSLHASRGRVCVELVSPVLKGTAGLQHVVAVVRKLKEMGAKVNTSCGLHVHVGFKSTDLRALQRLTHLFAGFERGVYASTGTKRREEGRYCRPIKEAFRNAKYDCINDLRNDYRVMSRYHGLNLTNLISGTRPTVEFRLFAGTMNPIKVAAYVQMVLGIVQVALSMPRPAKWDGKPAGEKFGGATAGPGERELNRLFRRLGWTKSKFYGRAGIMEGPGIPKLATCIKTLRMLAAKYDRS